MRITSRIRAVALGTLVAVILGGSAASTASAQSAIYDDRYANGVGLISGGTNWVNWSFYRTEFMQLKIDAYYNAYPMGYTVNSSGARISRNIYCEYAGCVAIGGWTSGPSGYPTVHHHGGSGQPDYFNARAWWRSIGSPTRHTSAQNRLG